MHTRNHTMLYEMIVLRFPNFFGPETAYSLITQWFRFNFYIFFEKTQANLPFPLRKIICLTENNEGQVFHYTEKQGYSASNNDNFPFPETLT